MCFQLDKLFLKHSTLHEKQPVHFITTEFSYLYLNPHSFVTQSFASACEKLAVLNIELIEMLFEVSSKSTSKSSIFNTQNITSTSGMKKYGFS